MSTPPRMSSHSYSEATTAMRQEPDRTVAAGVPRWGAAGIGCLTESRVVLLGTAAGRSWHGGTERAGISTALVVGNNVYLVDCGTGWGRRYLQAGLGEQLAFHGLERLAAVFLTHLHSDHIIDYPNLLTFGLSDGLSATSGPVRVFGPGGRGSLPPVAIPWPQEPPVVNEDNPTPGTVDLTNYLCQAFATDLNDNIRDGGRPDPRSLLDVSDIALPRGLVVHPNIDTAPTMNPFAVYEDDRVRVSATLVSHGPVFPSFAFRFDTQEGTVVFSGDTNASDNLVRLADNCDILIHEVIDPAWVYQLFPAPVSDAQHAKVRHLLNAHTPIHHVGKIADAAGARTLVLSHLAPADNPASRWREAQSGYRGRLVVGADLVEIRIRGGGE